MVNFESAKLPLTVVAGAGVAFGLYSFYWWYEVEKIEKPKYTVVKGLKSATTWLGKVRNTVELRHYQPCLIAETTVTKEPMRSAMSKGFMTVAKFIFGENQTVDELKSESIAMTSPVRMTMPDSQAQRLTKLAAPVVVPPSEAAVPLDASSDETLYKISFVMPSKYSKETLPVPKSEKLTITELPAHDAVALSFHGPSPSPQVIEAKRLELLAAMKESDLVPNGDLMVYQYHPPFAPSFLRVNEVLYMVKP